MKILKAILIAATLAASTAIADEPAQTGPTQQASCPAGWREYTGETGTTCVSPDPQGNLPQGKNPHGDFCPNGIIIWNTWPGEPIPMGCLNVSKDQRFILIPLLGVPEPVSYTKYPTAEAAAIAAFKEIAEKHGNAYEWGGMIGKSADGKFSYTPASTDFQGDSVEIPRAGLPPDMERYGAYHTHPCIAAHDVEFFSPQDLFAVIWGHEPAAFMGDWCTGNVHEYKRGDQPDTALASPGTWLTKGRIVGQFTTPHTMAAAQ